MEKNKAVTPAFTIGTVLESLGGLLFILVYIDFQIGPFRLRDYNPTLLYIIAAISFVIGVVLVIKDVMRKIEFIKEERKNRQNKQ